MRNQKKSGTDWGDAGCVAIIALFALPYIISSLLQAIMPFLLLGGIGFRVYQIILYDR